MPTFVLSPDNCPRVFKTCQYHERKKKRKRQDDYSRLKGSDAITTIKQCLILDQVLVGKYMFGKYMLGSIGDFKDIWDTNEAI